MNRCWDQWKPLAGRALFLVVPAFLGLGLMVRSYQLDPPNSSLRDTRAYGHNSVGVLGDLSVWVLVEFLVVFALCRPWRTLGLRARCTLASGVTTAWLLICVVSSMHGGGVVHAHNGWLLLLLVGLWQLRRFDQEAAR